MKNHEDVLLEENKDLLEMNNEVELVNGEDDKSIIPALILGAAAVTGVFALGRYAGKKIIEKIQDAKAAKEVVEDEVIEEPIIVEEVVNNEDEKNEDNE